MTAEIVEPTEEERRALFRSTNPDELKVELLNARAEAQYWRDRCAAYEAHHAKLEAAAADIRGRVEQFLVVLGHARPQGTERTASQSVTHP